MTPPMTRPMGPMLIILGGGIAVGLAIPFARRDDWLGWFSLAVVAIVSVFFWSMYLLGIIRQLLTAWRNEDSGSKD